MTKTNSDDIDEIEQILTKLVAKAHGLPVDDLPDGVGILSPSIDIQEAKAAISKKIVEAKINEANLILGMAKLDYQSTEFKNIQDRLKQLRSNDNE